MKNRKCYAQAEELPDVCMSFPSPGIRQVSGEQVEDEGYTLIPITKREIPQTATITHFHATSRTKIVDLICSAM